jgi:4-carboxymuconolactone decarboxylase
MTEERFSPLTLDEMNPGQKVMAEYILKTRGSLRAFEMLLRSPELGNRMQAVGEYIRYKNSISQEIIEIAILLVAKKLNSRFEWYEHQRISAQLGLDPKIVDAICRGDRPILTDDEAVVYDFSCEVLETLHASDEVYNRVVRRFGEIGVVDLSCTLGYYYALAILLNIGRYQLPPGVSSPLDNLG